VAEVVLGDGPVTGPSVDRAARLAAVTAPGQVLVTATAAGLLAGSGVLLDPTPDPDAWLVVAG
jgi:class 3 adenylate cyclase